MKRSRAWSKKGTRAIVTRPTTRANTTSILGAISAAGLIAVGVKKPRPTKKRKTDRYISSGTVTGHYISFLKMTLDEMDKHSHMKGHYIVMDNAPIHTHGNIKTYIEYRGYKCVYLPTYSPELNPIEQSWAVTKSKIKRHRFLQEDTLSKRITEACNSVEKGHFKGFVSHSSSAGKDVEAKCPCNAHNNTVIKKKKRKEQKRKKKEQKRKLTQKYKLNGTSTHTEI
jgi:transposase